MKKSFFFKLCTASWLKSDIKSVVGQLVPNQNPKIFAWLVEKQAIKIADTKQMDLIFLSNFWFLFKNYVKNYFKILNSHVKLSWVYILKKVFNQGVVYLSGKLFMFLEKIFKVN